MADRTFRFSEVAHAIGTTPKALRNWLSRDQVTVISEAPADGGWREFVIGDVLILALTRVIVDFGIDVKSANALARGIMDMRGDWLPDHAANDAVNYAMLIDRAVMIWPEGPHWNLAAFNVATDFAERAHLAPAFIVVRPEAVLRPALARALGEEVSG